MEAILGALVILVVGYTVGSVKIINQGSEALVERLGRFHRKLVAGLNFIVPLLDYIVWEDTTREQVLDIPAQEANTKDNIALKVDAIVYWQIEDLAKMYYNVENLDSALSNLVMTTLRAEIGKLDLEKTYSSRTELNVSLLKQLDRETTSWGVKVKRVEVQNINVPDRVRESLEQERAAQSRQRAAISEAEGKKKAMIEEALGTVQSINMISEALGIKSSPSEVMRFLIAQKYVDANYRLGTSSNSKIIFMDPKALTEAMSELITPDSNGLNLDDEPPSNPSKGMSASNPPPANPTNE